MDFSSLIIPAIFALIPFFAIYKKTDVYNALVDGATDGLHIMLRIAPALMIMLTAIAMLRASGALDLLTGLFSPLLSLLGIPPETTPLLMIRPLSGSGALAIFTDITKSYGADSQIGRTAAVMMGSTETTFYTIAVYFGAAGIAKTRHTIPAALCADLMGFITAAAAVKIFF